MLLGRSTGAENVNKILPNSPPLSSYDVWTLNFNVQSALIGTLKTMVIVAKVLRFVHLGI
jgi:hypothetical protein